MENVSLTVNCIQYRRIRMNKKGYVVLYDSFEEKYYIVHDFGRLDITSLLDVQSIKKDMKQRTGVITANIPIMLIDQD